jgi:hypothetical protein
VEKTTSYFPARPDLVRSTFQAGGLGLSCAKRAAVIAKKSMHPIIFGQPRIFISMES